MRKLLALLLTLWLAPALAQVPMTGAGKGVPVAATYQGPGDVFASASSWYSCSRSYSASYASSGTNGACDVVDTSTGLITCTYHIKTNGFVDPSECNGVGQSCQTACSVIKAYDQTGNGYHMLQSTATLAQLPHLTFSSTPTGTLPTIDCGTGAVFFMQATTSPVLSQPFTMSGVANRNSGTAESGFLGQNGNASLGFGSGANLAEVFGGAPALTKAATDSAWHSINGLFNGGGTSSAINVDGSDSTGATGAAGTTANTLRLCRAGPAQFSGLLAEAGVWAATSTSTDRNNLSSNQHGTSGYNF